MNSNRKSLKPRKTPVQARSTVTVAAIFEGCIQVLLDGGLERLTTTRVALRAGVSVGTLYQYYPNKESLLSAVLEAHLLTVVEAVEAACVDAKCGPVAAMAQAAVNAFVDAKLAQPATSRALYAVAADVGGSVVVARLTQRAQLTLCDMLATASDAHFSDLGLELHACHLDCGASAGHAGKRYRSGHGSCGARATGRHDYRLSETSEPGPGDCSRQRKWPS